MNKESKILLGLGLVTVVLIVFGSFFLTKPSQPSPEDLKPADPSLLVREDSYRRGKADAPVTIVEFGDFQCPACGSAEPIVERVLEAYPDKVQFIFRHFPLPMHANAQVSALAAEAAGIQGKFWEMHDMLYKKQNEWAEKSNAVDQFVKYAEELKLNVEDFKKAIQDKANQSRIDSGLTDGTAIGVDSTPTFYIQGIKHVGVLSENDFKTYIESALAAASN